MLGEVAEEDESVDVAEDESVDVAVEELVDVAVEELVDVAVLYERLACSIIFSIIIFADKEVRTRGQSTMER